MKRIKIREFVTMANTGADAIKRAPIVDYDSGVRCLRTSDVSNNKPQHEWGFCSVSDRDYNKFSLKKGDLLIARTGPIGKCYLIPENLKAVYNNGLMRIKIDEARFLPKYVYYCLRSWAFEEHIIRVGSGSATRPNIKMDIVLDYQIGDLPFESQKSIASILSAYDDLIENNTRRIAVLEEMARRIYQQWFVHFRFPGHEKVRMVDRELGRIPESWKLGVLRDVCRVIPGFAFKSKDWSDSGVPVIKIKNIRPGNVVDVDQVDCVPEKILQSKHDKYRLNNGAILIAMTGATAGKVGKLRTKASMMLNQRVAKLDPLDGYYELLWCRVSSAEAEKEFYRLADGAAQPNMSGSQIESVPVLIPSGKILDNFSGFVSPILDQTDNLLFKNANLRQTRDLLLPKLISGEIDVSEMPEPKEAAA